MLTLYGNVFCCKSAYGITDKLVDFYVLLAILCAFAASITIIVLKPQDWYVALIVAPFAAWGGPIALLLPVYIVEILVYGILHPKNSYKTILVGILFVSLLIGSAFLSYGIVRFCAACFATSDPTTWEVAYVSESPNAHRYHYSEHCKALTRTTYNIEMLSVDEAEDYEYEPCGLCLKESVRKQWDDAAGVVFIPVSCLLFGLINKIDQFNKKCKLRNPIVKR